MVIPLPSSSSIPGHTCPYLPHTWSNNGHTCSYLVIPVSDLSNTVHTWSCLINTAPTWSYLFNTARLHLIMVIPVQHCSYQSNTWLMLLIPGYTRPHMFIPGHTSFIPGHTSFIPGHTLSYRSSYLTNTASHHWYLVDPEFEFPAKR